MSATTMVVMGTVVEGNVTSGALDGAWATDVAEMIAARIPEATSTDVAEIWDWLVDGDLRPGQLVAVEDLHRRYAAGAGPAPFPQY